MDRQAKAQWMRAILDHLNSCYAQWEDADPRSERYLAASMCRDLEDFRRLCESLRGEPSHGLLAEVAH
jgi:hypothetical protein